MSPVMFFISRASPAATRATQTLSRKTERRRLAVPRLRGHSGDLNRAVIGKAMSSCDPVVLNYENCLLRQSDVELLTPPSWLNDNIIAFWFEYLENEVYKDHKKVLGFVCPQVVQYLKFGLPEDVKSTVEGLELDTKQYILFPVNDCRAQTVPGGTHWSLLAYNASENSFEHYDSYPGSCNLPVAESLAKVLAMFLRNSLKGGHPPVIHEMPCTQQVNTYDCGMHVICNAEGLCKKFITKDKRPLTEIVPSSVVARSRDSLKAIIYSLRK
ncbi:Sentrin-specific protease 8 [Araneus ventricosus]|uniref:Sentrin-specific protease 8 n=2 Tax=Araneus ventricosus TaxID=182803 RepID=A0A4Y2Q6H0_ARAVE|nr:Sentrin-specific protease 8 [Araneus ventricosus]GBN65497.1 Sentrin-specific protease 8 [Araneus ventricosus]